MNKFQKDLKAINNKILENRNEAEELKSNVEDLKTKNVNYNLLVYEVTNEIKELIIYRKRIKYNKRKIKEIEKNNKIVLFLSCATFLGFLLSFGVLFYNIPSLIICSILDFVISGFIIKINTHNIKKYKQKNKKDFKGYSINYINENLKRLEKKKQYLLDCIKTNEDKISEINKKRDSLNINFAKLRSDYNILLEYYQNIVSLIDVTEKDEAVEEFINSEYTKSLPIILKKLYTKKSD